MDSRLYAWWSHRQGLDGSLAGISPAEVLERTGWARSVGGVSPYLAMFARAGISREQADAALDKRQIQELPCARGCTYVVPASDFSLALEAGLPFADNEMKVARKLGVTDEEIERLRAAIMKALAGAPLGPDELKAKVGDAVRSLGPAGVKKGVTTTLPVALGLLQAAGEIRRIPVNGRLDQQRYYYAAWRPCPLRKRRKTDEEPFAELARKFFAWAGPATMADFQTFSGLGVKAAKVVTQPLGLITVEETRIILPENEEEFRKFKKPGHPQYALVSGIDNIQALREQSARGGNLTRDLEGQPIFDRGHLVGRWEFDPESGTVVWISFSPATPALKSAVLKTEAFIREQLGDARIFSLDSPKSRKPRIEALRKAGSER